MRSCKKNVPLNKAPISITSEPLPLIIRSPSAVTFVFLDDIIFPFSFHVSTFSISFPEYSILNK